MSSTTHHQRPKGGLCNPQAQCDTDTVVEAGLHNAERPDDYVSTEIDGDVFFYIV